MPAVATGHDLALMYIYQIALGVGASDAEVALWLDTPSLGVPGGGTPGSALEKHAQRIIELAELTFLNTRPGHVTRRKPRVTDA